MAVGGKSEGYRYGGRGCVTGVIGDEAGQREAPASQLRSQGGFPEVGSRVKRVVEAVEREAGESRRQVEMTNDGDQFQVGPFGEFPQGGVRKLPETAVGIGMGGDRGDHRE